MNLKAITKKALNALFGLGPDFVKDATYIRPISFSSSTGLTSSIEVSASIKMLVVTFYRRGVTIFDPNPPDEKILVRASELTTIISPARGDYIVQSSDGQRRDVLAAFPDLTGEFWTFHTLRSLNQDWGDLTPHTTSEDWADLSGATDSDDWGTLFL